MVRTAFITGATSGIGEATAIKLGNAGYRLIICGRRQERLDALKQQLEEKNIKVLTLCFDVRDRDAVKSTLTNLPEGWETVDVLVNNAGLAVGLSELSEGNIDDWERMIDTNVKGLLYVTRFWAEKMVAKKEGHIVNVSSIAGKEVYAFGNVYCGTKHMVDALTKAMRSEMAKHNVRVSAVNPGAVETEFSIVRFKGDVNKANSVYKGFENLVANDIAEGIYFMINRPAHVNINEMTIMSTAQPSAGVIVRK